MQVFVAEPAAFEPLFQQLRLCGFPGSVEPFENYQRHKDNYLPRLLPHPAGPPRKRTGPPLTQHTHGPLHTGNEGIGLPLGVVKGKRGTYHALHPVMFELKLTEPIRRGIVVMEAKAYVGGRLTTEASLMAQVAKNKA